MSIWTDDKCCYVCGKVGGHSIQTRPEEWQKFQDIQRAGLKIAQPDGRRIHDKCSRKAATLLQIHYLKSIGAI